MGKTGIIIGVVVGIIVVVAVVVPCVLLIPGCKYYKDVFGKFIFVARYFEEGYQTLKFMVIWPF